jgi:hypothetical protein
MPDLFLETATETKATELANHSFDDFLSLDLKAKEILPQINWVFTHKKVEYLGQFLW